MSNTGRPSKTGNSGTTSSTGRQASGSSTGSSSFGGSGSGSSSMGDSGIGSAGRSGTGSPPRGSPPLPTRTGGSAGRGPRGGPAFGPAGRLPTAAAVRPPMGAAGSKGEHPDSVLATGLITVIFKLPCLTAQNTEGNILTYALRCEVYQGSCLSLEDFC